MFVKKLSDFATKVSNKRAKEAGINGGKSASPATKEAANNGSGSLDNGCPTTTMTLSPYGAANFYADPIMGETMAMPTQSPAGYVFSDSDSTDDF